MEEPRAPLRGRWLARLRGGMDEARQGLADEQLLDATVCGDEEAFVEIYRRHHERVFRFAIHMTGSVAAAEDVTHDSFASLLESPRRFCPGGRASLGTYLCAAARNQSLKRLRRARREVLGTELGREPSAEGDPLAALLEDERVCAVRDAILRLRPLHREVVILFELEGLDLATVSEIVGAEVGAVKVRLHRARRKLRQALEDYMACGAGPRSG